MVSLDGFFEDASHGIFWHNVNPEFNGFAIKQLDSVDTLLFGRITYGGMASYWPTPAAIKNDPIAAARMNDIRKIVFSRMLPSAEWSNTRLVRDNVREEVLKLKQEPGKEIADLRELRPHGVPHPTRPCRRIPGHGEPCPAWRRENLVPRFERDPETGAARGKEISIGERAASV